MASPPTATAQERKFYVVKNNIYSYLPKNVKAAKKQLQGVLKKHAPDEPFDCPVYVKIIWCFPYKKSEKKENIGKVIPKTTRPDTANLNKMLHDIMTECGYWQDDALIVRGTEEKCWYEKSGIYIKVLPVDERFSQKIEEAVNSTAREEKE